MAENPKAKFFCIIGHDVIMPERLPAAKKFGCRSRHCIKALLRAKLARFLKEHRERVGNGNVEVSAK
jgi:hypothetical protein